MDGTDVIVGPKERAIGGVESPDETTASDKNHSIRNQGGGA